MGGWSSTRVRTGQPVRGAHVRVACMLARTRSHTHRASLAHRLRALPARVGRRDDVMLEGKEQHRR